MYRDGSAAGIIGFLESKMGGSLFTFCIIFAYTRGWVEKRHRLIAKNLWLLNTATFLIVVPFMALFLLAGIVDRAFHFFSRHVLDNRHFQIMTQLKPHYLAFTLGLTAVLLFVVNNVRVVLTTTYPYLAIGFLSITVLVFLFNMH